MADWRDAYWRECIGNAAEECSLSLTEEQLDALADAAQSGHENYVMASGEGVASSNWHAAHKQELADTRKALQREKDKVTCRSCSGRGWNLIRYGTRESRDECHKCHGDGRHDP